MSPASFRKSGDGQSVGRSSVATIKLIQIADTLWRIVNATISSLRLVKKGVEAESPAAEARNQLFFGVNWDDETCMQLT